MIGVIKGDARNVDHGSMSNSSFTSGCLAAQVGGNP